MLLCLYRGLTLQAAMLLSLYRGLALQAAMLFSLYRGLALQAAMLFSLYRGLTLQTAMLSSLYRGLALQTAMLLSLYRGLALQAAVARRRHGNAGQVPYAPLSGTRAAAGQTVSGRRPQLPLGGGVLDFNRKSWITTVISSANEVTIAYLASCHVTQNQNIIGFILKHMPLPNK
ncbi:hypothetical protein DPMN_127563 [Dreissena polymorpha]|uniref:Uncharacterized protein n=1 Tax=Dreissena polymorpha TaxID=45954 RepID=A0A9D4JYX2_DREPO|nr:hypothetical protein DPMN_127563 [Dreissena polymorpha]